jgi:predicted dinucleotide-binding enzyme
MTTGKSKVAIIGTGTIGKILATNLTTGNRSVLLADKDLTKAKELSRQLGSLAQPREIGAAIKEADIVIMSVWLDSAKELLTRYNSELQGKIIVDPSNPIAPDGKGGFVKTVGEKESSGELLSALLPKGAKLAKALGTLGAPTLASASRRKPEPAVEFYVTNDNSINGEVEELIRNNGFEPLRVGGIDQSIRLEVFGDLHEFGALGKAVTMEEAKKLSL